MEISGKLIAITEEYLRIITDDKLQEIDIFFSASKKFDAETLLINQRIIFDVKLQTVDHEEKKLAKLWLNKILVPPKIIKDIRSF